MLIVSVLAILALYLPKFAVSYSTTTQPLFFIRTHFIMVLLNIRKVLKIMIWHVCFFCLEIINGKNGQRANRDEITVSTVPAPVIIQPAQSLCPSVRTTSWSDRVCEKAERSQKRTKTHFLPLSTQYNLSTHTHPALISSVGCSIWALSSAVRASCWVRRKWRAAPISSTVIMAGWVSRRGVS